jgi:ectoine hydroxylase-related dioxygenase (phytanoyl-CoA dioxygenase family)
MTTTSVQTHFDLEQHYPLSKEQIEGYRNNGYIKLKNVLSPDAVRYYARLISAKVRELNTLHLPMEQRTTYEKAFLQIQNLWTQDSEIRQFVFSRRLARLAAELMGCRGVRMYHDQALYKEPGGGFTPWHADQAYWPVDTDKTTTVWIPLQPTPLKMGPLAFSAGSQRYGTARDLDVSDESEVAISKTLLESGLPIDETPFELGEVSFHTGWTYHRAGANNTDQPREVITVIYIDADAKVAPPKTKSQKTDIDKWMPGLKAGDPVATELNPIMYIAE